MKRFFLILCCLSALSLRFAHADDDQTLPLPNLTDEELKMMQQRGQLPDFGILLNPDLLDQQPLPPGLADSPQAHQPNADLSRFLPPTLVAPLRPLASKTTKDVPVHDVNDDFIEQASNAPQDMLLIDPNGELHESRHEEFQRFLDFHARDARIALHVLVLGKHERLPRSVRLGDIGSGALQRGRACLAVVPFGDPARARLFLSRDVIDAADGQTLNSILDDIVKEALSSKSSTEQFHRLLVRLSVRLFWLERSLPKDTVAAATPPPEPETIRSAVPVASPALPMMEIGARPVPSRSWVDRWSIAAVLLILSVLGWWVHRRWWRHKLRTHSWTLPMPTEILPRLGGMHCGSAACVRWP